MWSTLSKIELLGLCGNILQTNDFKTLFLPKWEGFFFIGINNKKRIHITLTYLAVLNGPRTLFLLKLLNSKMYSKVFSIFPLHKKIPISGSSTLLLCAIYIDNPLVLILSNVVLNFRSRQWKWPHKIEQMIHAKHISTQLENFSVYHWHNSGTWLTGTSVQSHIEILTCVHDLLSVEHL